MINIVLKRNQYLVSDPDHGKLLPVRRPVVSFRGSFKQLRNRSLVIGFVGPRGSGKSVGAARTVLLDYLIRGRDVWSNMEVKAYLPQYDRIVQTKPLDKLGLLELDQVFSDGAIYIDEINLLTDSRRSQSNNNMNFSYIVQQIRKRDLDVIYSAQDPMTYDNRLRAQTDLFVSCTDLSLLNPKVGMGQWSHWKVTDFSGMVQKPDNNNYAVIYAGNEYNRAWWNSYSTFEIQDVGAGEPEEVGFSSESQRIAAEVAKMFELDPDSRIPVDRIKARFKLVTNYALKKEVFALLSEEYGIGRDSGGNRLMLYEDALV